MIILMWIFWIIVHNAVCFLCQLLHHMNMKVETEVPVVMDLVDARYMLYRRQQVRTSDGILLCLILYLLVLDLLCKISFT